MTIENQCLNNCWGKLFKSEIIKNNKIRFDSQMKIGEDAKFVLEYLQESSSLKICNLPLQAYIINEEGAMRKAGLEALGDSLLIGNTDIFYRCNVFCCDSSINRIPLLGS